MISSAIYSALGFNIYAATGKGKFSLGVNLTARGSMYNFRFVFI